MTKPIIGHLFKNFKENADHLEKLFRQSTGVITRDIVLCKSLLDGIINETKKLPTDQNDAELKASIKDLEELKSTLTVLQQELIVLDKDMLSRNRNQQKIKTEIETIKNGLNRIWLLRPNDAAQQFDDTSSKNHLNMFKNMLKDGLSRIPKYVGLLDSDYRQRKTANKTSEDRQENSSPDHPTLKQ